MDFNTSRRAQLSTGFGYNHPLARTELVSPKRLPIVSPNMYSSCANQPTSQTKNAPMNPFNVVPEECDVTIVANNAHAINNEHGKFAVVFYVYYFTP